MPLDAATADEMARYLDGDELLYFQLNRIEGMTRQRCAAALGWPDAKVENVRRRLNKRLVALRGPAPKLITREMVPDDYVHSSKGIWLPITKYSYVERLPSGKRVWALMPSKRTMCPALVISREPILKGPHPVTMTTTNLRQNLADEKAKLLRLAERAHSTRLSYEKAERDLDKAMTEAKADQARAVLDEKEYVPTAETRKKLAQAQNAVAHTQSEVDATAEALRLQAIRVEELEIKIAGRAHEEFVAEAGEIAQRIMRALPALGDDVTKLQTLACNHKQDYYAMMALLFPGLKLGEFTMNSYYNKAAGVILAVAALPTANWGKAAAMGE